MNLIKTGSVFLQIVKKNSPIILSVAAGIGLAALYILTIKETEEAVQEINEAPEEEVHSFKMAKKVVKIMAPSFVVLLLTMFCIVKSCTISQHRIRDLTQYSAVLAATFNQYRQKNRELSGPDGPENNDQIIMTEIAAEKMDAIEPIQDQDLYNNGVLCFLIGYDNYFMVPSINNLWYACAKANERIREGYKTVTLLQWMRWANAEEFDEHGNVRGFNMRYIHYGWEENDLGMMDEISGTYPWITKSADDSGLEYFIIDVPIPKPLESEWSYV